MEHFPSIFKYSDSIFQFMIFMGGETQPQLACQEKRKLCGVYFISIFHNLHLLLYINIMANVIKGTQPCQAPNLSMLHANWAEQEITTTSMWFFFVHPYMYVFIYIFYVTHFIKNCIHHAFIHWKTLKMQSLSFYTVEKP